MKNPIETYEMQRERRNKQSEQLWDLIARHCSRSNKKMFDNPETRDRVLEQGVSKHLKQIQSLEYYERMHFIRHILQDKAKDDKTMESALAIVMAETLFGDPKNKFIDSELRNAIDWAAMRNHKNVYDLLIRTHRVLTANEFQRMSLLNMEFFICYNLIERNMYIHRFRDIFIYAIENNQRKLIDALSSDKEVRRYAKNLMHRAIECGQVYPMKKLYELGQEGFIEPIYVDFSATDKFNTEMFQITAFFLSEAFERICPGQEERVKHNMFLALPIGVVLSNRLEWKKLGVDICYNSNQFLIQSVVNLRTCRLDEILAMGVDVNAREGLAVDWALRHNIYAMKTLVQHGAKFFPHHISSVFEYLKLHCYWPGYEDRIPKKLEEIAPYFQYERDLPPDAILNAFDTGCVPLFLDVLKHVKLTPGNLEWAKLFCFRKADLDEFRQAYVMIEVMENKLAEMRRLSAKPACMKRDRDVDE